MSRHKLAGRQHRTPKFLSWLGRTRRGPAIRTRGNSKEGELEASQARPRQVSHSLTSSDDRHIIVRRFMEIDGICSIASRQVSVFMKPSVMRPRLRSKASQGGEVAIPVYPAAALGAAPG
jgi:hypothetical protein